MLFPLKKSKLQNVAGMLVCLVSMHGMTRGADVQNAGRSMDKAANISRQDQKENLNSAEKIEASSTLDPQGIYPAYEMPVVEYLEMPLVGEEPDTPIVDAEGAPPVQIPAFQGKIPRAKNPIVNPQPRLDKACTGCIDILMEGQIYSDPSVNMVYSYVYTLCLMEWVIQKYLKSQKYIQIKNKTEIAIQENALSEVQRILPSYLLGFSMLVNAFKNEDFRKEIDFLRQKATSMDNGVNLTTPST